VQVAQLQQAAGQALDASRPYAELWWVTKLPFSIQKRIKLSCVLALTVLLAPCRMGTHPSGAATLAEGDFAGAPLLAFIRDNPQVLGEAGPQFGADLPFLLKVLSVRTALSIQSHPDKVLAERLHRERPGVYKDGNHKPEMALALADFEALCGFAPHAEVAAALAGAAPELRECCGAAAADAYVSSAAGQARRAALRAAFTALMTAEPAVYSDCVERMAARLRHEAASRSLTPKESLALRLEDQYPGDVGVLASWFLNYVRLQPGEAIALAANEPHAYVSGEIVECMATSDNVIRAGLTPKLRDTAVLCSSLTYAQGAPAVLHGERDAGRSLTLYRPEFREFEVWRFDPGAGAEVELAAARGPMILLVQRGSARLAAAGGARRVKRGDVLFIPAGTALATSVDQDLVAWFAAPNSMGL
jgi:mannose-6-phosphate isomerase